MYLIIGKIVAIIFFTIATGGLLIPKLRKLIARLFDGTPFSDILVGDRELMELDDDDNPLLMVGLGTLAFLMIVLYILGMVVISFLFVVMWPIPLFGLLTGLVLFKKKKNK